MARFLEGCSSTRASAAAASRGSPDDAASPAPPPRPQPEAAAAAPMRAPGSPGPQAQTAVEVAPPEVLDQGLAHRTFLFIGHRCRQGIVPPSIPGDSERGRRVVRRPFSDRGIRRSEESVQGDRFCCARAGDDDDPVQGPVCKTSLASPGADAEDVVPRSRRSQRGHVDG